MMTRALAVAATEWRLGTRCVHLVPAGDLGAAVDVDEQLRGAAPVEPPYWMHLWPGAIALARRVATSAQVGPSSRVIEIGCGLALPAVTAAVCGATVVATDRVRAPLQLARRSAARSNAALTVLQMDWTALAVDGVFDLCLGTDIGYDFRGAELLAGALRRLVRPGGWVWLADSVNLHRQELLDALRAAGFALRCHETQETEEGRPVWVRLVEAQVPR
jgi:predicted nicotinamide N-methyase